MIGFFELIIIVAIPSLLAVPASVLVLLASRRMARLESYSFCVFASILAVLPIHVGFIFTLPLGVWSLATLQRPEIRRAFQAKEDFVG